MTTLITWCTSGVYMAGAVAASVKSKATEARRVAVATSLIALVFVTVGASFLTTLGLQPLPPDLRLAIPAVATASLVAVALAPVARHAPATFGRVLALVGLTLPMFTSNNPWLLTALWAATAVVPWLELRSREATRGTARLFATYHAVSIACFALAAVFLSVRRVELAAVPLLLALGIRGALLPVHSWFPRFIQQSPMAIVVAFTVAQVGVWAHLTSLSADIPDIYAHQLARVGAATALIGAALGVVQKTARRALAYLFLSQSALLAFGVTNASPVALWGTVIDAVVQCLAFAGFAMSLSALEARRGTASLIAPNGNFSRTPKLATAFLVMGFASVGFPLTLGFVAEDLLVQGSIHEFPRLGISLIVTTALNGMNVARAFFLLFTGNDEDYGEVDLTRREFAAMTLVMAALLGAGLFPGWVTNHLQPVSSHTGQTRHSSHSFVQLPAPHRR